jgi:hypothetical protein
MKKGFMAYEEIKKDAEALFNGKDVRVLASIFGDDYNIIVDGIEVMQGCSVDIRNRLWKLFEVELKKGMA